MESANGKQREEILLKILKEFGPRIISYLDIKLIRDSRIEEIKKKILDPLTDLVGIDIRDLSIYRVSLDWHEEKKIAYQKIKDEMVPIEFIYEIGPNMIIFLDVILAYYDTEIHFSSVLSINDKGHVETRKFDIEEINKIDKRFMKIWNNNPKIAVQKIEEIFKKFAIPISVLALEKLIEVLGG